MIRAEAINWLINIMSDIGKAEHRDLWHYEQALAEIKKMLEEEPQWIPCSSGQMPDDLAEVNITWVNRDPEPYYAFLKDKPFTGSAVYYKSKWYWYSCVCVDILNEYGENPSDALDDAIDVIAWKPFEEPWRGDAE